MEFNLSRVYRPLAISYRDTIAKSWALTSLFGILWIILREWSIWILMMDLMDKQLMLQLNFTGSAFTDQFWYGFTQKTVWLPLMIVATVTTVKNGPEHLRDKIIFVLATTLLVVALDQISSGIIKPLVGRLRPSHDPSICYLLHYVNGYHGGRYGFVSGHAMVTVGVVTWLCKIYRNKLTQGILIVFAGTMCYSRIYLGVHYPGDILCGAFLGYLLAQLSFRFLRHYITIRPIRKIPYILIMTLSMTLVFLVIMAK